MEKQEFRLVDLFYDFSLALENNIEHMERTFGVTGLMDQLFGRKEFGPRSRLLKTNPAWQILETAYKYGLEGIPPPSGFAYELGSDPAFVLAKATPLGGFPSKNWEFVVATSCARLCLDKGYEMDPENLALLAGVELSTVRSAINDGELLARDEGNGEASIRPTSASRWLLQRQDFKPTQVRDVALPIDSVKNPLDFRTAIVKARENAGIDTAQAAAAIGHPRVDAAALDRLERGLFGLPLEVLPSLAGVYGLDEKEFEAAVLRVFFHGDVDWMRRGKLWE